MSLVSIYNHAYHSGTDTEGQRAPNNLDLEIILDSIKNGKYEKDYPLAAIRLAKSNYVLEMERTNGEKDEKTEKAYKILKSLKDKIPRFTISGVFKETGRSQANLEHHSGFIDIDIDGSLEMRDQLIRDPYTYAVFTSCGGDGLCVIFKVEPSKHEQAFEGVQAYFYSKYGLIIDNAHKNPANTRNFSYDPNLYCLGRNPETFKQYLKVKKAPPKISFIYAKNDFEECVKQVVGQQLDFCPDYSTYRAVGFSIANKFGLDGLDYFDAVCQFGAKYDAKKIAKDYRYLCRNPDGKTKIATFFYRCKELNLEIYSKETKVIGSYASAACKSGRSKDDVIRNLEEHDGYSKELTEPIVNQVFDEKIEFVSSDGILDDIQGFIKYNYNLRLNSLTGKFENNEVEVDEAAFNSILIDVKKAYEKADARWIERILFSSFVPSYNPIRDWFKENEHLALQVSFIGDKVVIPHIIQDLWASVRTKSAAYTEKFGTKWLVGAVSTWFGSPSDLELIFAGELEKGKTHFIRYLIPEHLQKYYAEIKIDGSDNCAVQMCQNMIINQNECGGKSKQDDKIHKEILDKKVFSLRRPYRRDPEKMQRIAALFGTTNDVFDILTDRTGNRRIIVDEVLSRDFTAYDSIDKTELWMAVYALWKAGFEWKILGEDIKQLNSQSSQFEQHGLEYELINEYYEKCEADDTSNLKLTSAQIKVYIESKTDQQLRLPLIIQELYRMKYKIVEDKSKGLSKKYYNIKLASAPLSLSNPF